MSVIDTTVPFPDCILNVLRDRLVLVDGVENVHLRSLHPTDDNGSVGVDFSTWMPGEMEMGGGASFEPTIARYVITIEHLVKHDDRVEGNKVHRSVGRSIRSMLYRDQPTQVALRQLKHVEDSGTERMMKWGLEQAFASNEIGSAFYFVSQSTVTFETETV